MVINNFTDFRPLIGDDFVALFDAQSGQDRLPAIRLLRSKEASGWSADMSDFLEETSEHHFIDKYNRGLMLRGLKPYISKDSKYLDVGCSSGFMLRDMHALYPQLSIAGCDYDQAGLMHCSRRFPEFPLFQVNLTDCPFKDNSFNAITCLNVLEHINDDVKAIQELFRILKPGGGLGLTVPLGPHLYDCLDEIHYHVRRYVFKDLLEKIVSTGFSIRRANRFGVIIYPAFYVIKRSNQLKYRHKTFDKKHKIALNQTKKSSGGGRSTIIMERVCSIEECIGRIIPYPMGIRAYVIAEKMV